MEAAENQMHDLILVAPRSGVIGYRQVEVGSLVQAGQKLLSIVDNSKIYVDCQISEQDLAALFVGEKLDISVESLSKTFAGEIIYLSPSLDSQTQTFAMRILLANPDESLRSGMFARGTLDSVIQKNVIIVPKEALLEKNGKYYVYVLSSDNTVAQRAVQDGRRGDKDVEILRGLNEGEEIAVTNLARLRDKMPVNPNRGEAK